MKMHEPPKMSRSVSMPVKPDDEPQSISNLKRSNEKEKVYSENENSLQYLYEDDELHYYDDDDDDEYHDHDNFHHHNIEKDKISLDINTENVILKRYNNSKGNTTTRIKNNIKEIQINKSNLPSLKNQQQRRRRRHSSTGIYDDDINTIILNTRNISYNNSDSDTDDVNVNYIHDKKIIKNNQNQNDDDDDDDDDDNYEIEINSLNSEVVRDVIKTKNHNNDSINQLKYRNEYKNQAIPGPSGITTTASSSQHYHESNPLKQRYRKEKRCSSNSRKASLASSPAGRRPSEGWFGSTIEINNQDDTNDSRSFEDDEFVEDRFIRRSISRNINRRLIGKNGYQNVSFKNIPKRSLRYCKDLITTLIELEWSWVLSIFVVIFLGSWIIFAGLWYLIAKAHGDLDFDPITGHRLGDGKIPCVHGVYDATGMFIHSLELQTTIGFGEKYPTEECPEGVFLFVFQIISSIAFEGAIVAVVYAKMARPVKLLSKFTFSKTACICLRDGKFCFIFRVCDPREQKCIATKIRAYLVTDATTPEGETMKVNTELKLEGNGTGIIIWPETICHIIDKTSPFYKFTAIDFHTKNFEVFISLIGHSPLTGQCTESRTSYLPHEILWGQRYPNIIDYSHVKLCYTVDYNNFHTTIAANIPFKSPYHLDRLKL